MDPIFIGNIDPDNRKNHKKYDHAPTCVRCGRAVTSAGCFLRISGGDWILANDAASEDIAEYALGSECMKRVPATHRMALTDEIRERIMARESRVSRVGIGTTHRSRHRCSPKVL